MIEIKADDADRWFIIDGSRALGRDGIWAARNATDAPLRKMALIWRPAREIAHTWETLVGKQFDEG
jgi:hypothetical protein